MEFHPRHQSSWYIRGFSAVLLLSAGYYVILSHQRLIPLPLQFITHIIIIIIIIIIISSSSSSSSSIQP
jgi:hypothetical protein